MSRQECPNPQDDCKYASLSGGCFSDVHHTYYPKKHYRDIMSKEFRELPENKNQICRNEHDEIHATQPDPEKPSREVMIAAIALAGELE